MTAPKPHDEYVVGYADTGTPVSNYATIHLSRSGADGEVKARTESNPGGVGYVVLTRKATPWTRA